MYGDTEYYAVLGLNPHADHVVVHAAWEALLRKHHPDTNAGAHAAEQARAINEAFAVLGKPDARADYDRARGGRPTIAPHRQEPSAAPLFRTVPRRRTGIAGPAISLAVLTLIALPTAGLALLANPDTAPATHRMLVAYSAGSPFASGLVARFERLVPKPPADSPPADPKDKAKVATAR
jgi:curved DNA-binding protein CbpA